MTNILFVSSSPRGAASQSSKVAEQLIAGIRAEDPTATVTRRDLAANPLPHLDGEFLGAIFGPAEAHTVEQTRLLALSDQLVDEIFAADVIVIASAMINFTVPSTLKSWFDFIARRGRTFSYGENGPEGLVKGKRVVVVEAKGGIYSDGPMKVHDYQQPWMRFMLGFLGMTDVEVIYVEGQSLGADRAAQGVTEASSRANDTARALASRIAA
ncbi:FMN-dependent NADH-azoreductase [Mesorhizobium sp. BR1-1-16]|uniref:FMN-dependent NADH-azoreductase n=1 Tax=Mesorhizobium sp. BR1-1-16 TaxID=2876653 RepID=UPI001CCFF996|nr:FMN-dependent NADH-azoreductase [Mesorhizobium sp. BR1-1-16]MBZ9935310.1 FMN-dependent NADH-azoreductase [Mesorhizobium sp. BR1-1-16]